MTNPGKPVWNHSNTLRHPRIQVTGAILEARDNVCSNKSRDHDNNQGCPRPVREGVPEWLDEIVWRVIFHVGRSKSGY